MIMHNLNVHIIVGSFGDAFKGDFLPSSAGNYKSDEPFNLWVCRAIQAVYNLN